MLRTRWFSCWAMVLCLTAGALAQPVNDDCANAEVAADGNNLFDTTLATETTPGSCGLSAPEVWFTYNASCDGLLTVETNSGPGTDTVLWALDGCGGLELDCDDDGGTGFLSIINFSVVAGNDYIIAVSGWNGGTGAGDFDITCTPIVGSDGCAGAVEAFDGSNTYDTTGFNQTVTPSCGIGAPEEWFFWEATCDGIATVTTTQPDPMVDLGDTLLQVYGTCGGAEIACNDDATGTLSEASFSAVSGTTYLIAVSGWNGATGTGGFEIACNLVVGNDTCDNAEVITNGTTNVDTSTFADTFDAGCGISGPDAWYLYTADCDGILNINTAAGSVTDTLLWAILGNDCLAPVADCDDDGGAGLLSNITLSVMTGDEVLIGISGWNGQSGTMDLIVDCVLPPDNDTCDGAISSAVEAFDGITNVDTTVGVDSGFAFTCGTAGGNDQHFLYTASCDGALAISTLPGSVFGTNIAVTSGQDCLLGVTDCSTTETLIVPVVSAGDEFIIHVRGDFGASGTFDLSILCSTPPANDTCDMAETATDGANPFDLTLATDTNPFTCGIAGPDAWFTYTVSCDGTVILETDLAAGSLNDSVLEAILGDDCLGAIFDCDDDGGPGLASQIVVPNAIAGDKIIIGVGGWNGQAGSGDLVISCTPPPDNDTCADAVSNLVEAFDGLTTFNTSGATDSEDFGCGISGPDLHFLYTASCDGAVVVSTEGPGSLTDTVLALRAGDCASPFIDCDDDGGPGLYSVVVASGVSAGDEFIISVQGWNGQTGDAVLNIECLPPPANDECAGAEVITDGILSWTNITATDEMTTTPSCGVSGLDTWYEYEFTCDGIVLIDSPLFNQQITAYDACGGAELGCATGGTLTVAGTTGDTILLQVSLGAGGTGQTDITVSCIVPLDNDTCALADSNMIEIFDGMNTVDTTGALSSETTSCGADAPEVWFVYVATCDGAVNLMTSDNGGIADTVVAVYGDCGGPILGCNDDSGGTFFSNLTVGVVSGETYYIYASGWAGSTGSFNLDIECLVPTAPNNDCLSATDMVDGSNAWDSDGSLPTVAPSCVFGDLFDVWYSYEATCDGNVIVTDETGNFPSIALYDSCGGTELDCGGGDAVAFNVITGDKLFIQVGIAGGTTGAGSLNIQCLPPLANDTCDTAIEALDGTTPFDTLTASQTSTPGCGIAAPEAWFTYEVTCDGQLTIDTAGSPLDTILSIWGDCPSLGGVELACNDDAIGLQSEVTLPVVTGDTLLIAVSGWAGSVGVGSLNIDCFTPPSTADKYVIIDASDGVGDVDDVAGVQTALIDSGVSSDDIEVLPDATLLNGTPTVIILLNNTFPNNRPVSATEGQAIQDACVLDGVPVWISGGDIFAFTTTAELEAIDGIDSLASADGDDSHVDATGTDFLVDATGPYTQDNAGNDWTDQLVLDTVADSVGSTPASVMTDTTGGYIVGVFHAADADQGNVFCTSNEFTGWSGDQPALMTEIMTALEVDGSGGTQFIRGDLEANGDINATDAVTLLSALFAVGAPPIACEDAANVQTNDMAGIPPLNVSDPVFLLAFLFSGGPAPAQPFPSCGTADPGTVSLGCDTSAFCPQP